MKEVIFSNHAEKRRRQRGFTDIEIHYVLERPTYKKKRTDELVEVTGTIRGRITKVVYKEEENYIKIVSVM